MLLHYPNDAFHRVCQPFWNARNRLARLGGYNPPSALLAGGMFRGLLARGTGDSSRNVPGSGRCQGHQAPETLFHRLCILARMGRKAKGRSRLYPFLPVCANPHSFSGHALSGLDKRALIKYARSYDPTDAAGPATAASPPPTSIPPNHHDPTSNTHDPQRNKRGYWL